MIAIKSADAFEHEAFGPQRVGSMERCAVEEQGEPRVAEFERLAEIAENGYCMGCGLCFIPESDSCGDSLTLVFGR